MSRIKERRGTVLIVVLVIITMVSLAAYHFTMSMEFEHIATRNAGNQIKAQQAAHSGVEVVAAMLQVPRARRTDPQKYAGREIELWSDQNQNGDKATFQIHFDALDESGKLNLHTLLKWEHEYPGHAREALLRLPDMDEFTANRILDWIDSDTQSRVPNGEMHARNSIPLCVDELAFLAKQPGENSREQTASPVWLRYLTVHSAERNETFDGQERIDLNAPDLRGLHEILTRSVSIELADYVIRFRQFGMDLSLDASNSSADPAPIDFTIPATTDFLGLGELIGSSVAVPSESGSKSVSVPSPIELSGANIKPLDQIFDLLTVRRDTRIIGRINLQTAPVEVIAAIPGIDQTTAQQIVQTRGFGGQSRFVGQRHRHVIGILSSTAIDLTIVSEILDQVTIGGDVVKAQITGRYGDQIPEFRCESIIDASDGKTKQIMLRMRQD